MPPPSEPSSIEARRGRTRTVVIAVPIACFVVAAFVYTAMNPVRLMAQARQVNGASGELAPSKFRFPSAAALPDGHRSVSLETPAEITSYNYKTDETTHQPQKTELRLASIDAPDMSRTLIPDVPKEMGSLVGVTNDLLLVSASTAPPAKGVVESQNAKPSAVTLTKFGIVGNPAAARRILTHAPIPGVISEMALSPTGDRILWAVNHERKPYGFVASAAKHVKFLARYATVKNVLSLYETDGEGRNPIKVGDEVESTEPHKGGLWMDPADFAYDNGAQNIRFTYGHGFYEVPAPRR